MKEHKKNAIESIKSQIGQEMFDAKKERITKMVDWFYKYNSLPYEPFYEPFKAGSILTYKKHGCLVVAINFLFDTVSITLKPFRVSKSIGNGRGMSYTKYF